MHPCNGIRSYSRASQLNHLHGRRGGDTYIQSKRGTSKAFLGAKNCKLAGDKKVKNKLALKMYSTSNWQSQMSTEKCRFMDKRVREILRFFVALRREFAPAVWHVSWTFLSRNSYTSVQFVHFEVLLKTREHKHLYNSYLSHSIRQAPGRHADSLREQPTEHTY